MRTASTHAAPAATNFPDTLRIDPARAIKGKFTVPGDKSVTHRAYLLGALATGTTRVIHPNPGGDCLATMKAIESLGARLSSTNGEKEAEDEIRIEGVGGVLPEPEQVINCMNSGTTMRILTGILSGGTGLGILTGDDSLCSRPMARIIEPLERMGARIYSRSGARAPLVVRAGRLKGIRYELPIASSQVKSALLLAGLKAEGTTTVIEPVPTRDHTERMLKLFGAPVAVEKRDFLEQVGAGGGTAMSIIGGTRLVAADVQVPGDLSMAVFFLVAALILPDSEVVIEGVGMNPTRRGAIDALIEMGGEIELRGLTDEGFEPVATVVARSSRLHGITIGGDRIPSLIDELPVLAVAAAFASGSTVVTDASELRVKESDRIERICGNLTTVGVRVEEREDGFVVHGGPRPQGATVDALGDHRIAMAMAVLALGAGGPIEIRGADGIATSFPDFADEIQSSRAQR